MNEAITLTDAEREKIQAILDSYNDHYDDVTRAHAIVEEIIAARLAGLR